MEDVEEHLVEEHWANVCFSPSVVMKCTGFAQAIKRNYSIVFVVHGWFNLTFFVFKFDRLYLRSL